MILTFILQEERHQTGERGGAGHRATRATQSATAIVYGPPSADPHTKTMPHAVPRTLTSRPNSQTARQPYIHTAIQPYSRRGRKLAIPQAIVPAGKQRRRRGKTRVPKKHPRTEFFQRGGEARAAITAT